MLVDLEEIKAKQEMHLGRMKAKEDACQEKLEAHQKRVESLLGLRPSGEVTEACTEKSKASLEETEAPELEKTLEGMETTVYQQERLKEETSMDNVGSLRDHYDDQRLVVRRH
jgi:hypothetical protein